MTKNRQTWLPRCTTAWLLVLLSFSLCHHPTHADRVHTLRSSPSLRLQSLASWQSSPTRREQKQRRAVTATKATAADMAAALAGPGLTITNATFLVGSADQFGVFDQGTDGIGMASGIVLSTGKVEAPGSTEVGGDGYTPLKQFISGGYISRDAAVLEIQFMCNNADADDFNFNYVFASNEYNEYVNGVWNDVFALFFNGLAKANNIATLGAEGTAVSIKSVNCGNPYNAKSNNTYCSQFVNNDLRKIAVPLDGFTKPLTARRAPQLGSNVLTIAITDVGDRKYDSAVFLQAGSFSCVSSSTAAPSGAPSAHPGTMKPTAPKTATKRPHRRTRRPTPRPTRTRPTAAPTVPEPPLERCLRAVESRCDCAPLCPTSSAVAADWSCPQRVVRSDCPDLDGADRAVAGPRRSKSKGNGGMHRLYRRFRLSCNCPAIVTPSSKSKTGGGKSHKSKKGGRAL